ncbi:MAG: FAD-binding protein [Clostridia bacterium]|jgi:flavin-dependent dehydrogenase|nr:FAD-binding protein [Clostridia bacterium]MBT7122491.1 FAD-binding protein [Clostridia bacterium]
MYDIAVVGIGPAGANFLRLVDTERYSVAAIDKKAMDGSGGYRKPCGGLLAPDAQRALAKLNLSLPGDVIASPQIFYVKTIDLDSEITKNYQRFYINIDRQKFDVWMMSMIPQSVDVFERAMVRSIREEDGVYRIEVCRGGEVQVIEAKHVIGADGANGIVSRCFFGKTERNLRLSVQEWYEMSNREPVFSCVFDSENCDSYSWFLSKNRSFVFGGAYEIDGASQSFANLKEKLEGHGICLDSPVRREACLVYRLRTPSDFCVGGGSVLMIGEAAGFVSPSSYEGISGALDSSCLLSEVFNDSDEDVLRRYRRTTRGMRRKYTVKIVKSRILNNNLLRKLIMKSGVQSLEIAKQRETGGSSEGLADLTLYNK